MTTLLNSPPFVIFLTSYLPDPNHYRPMNIDSTSFSGGQQRPGGLQVGNPGNINHLRTIAQLTGITDPSRLNDLVRYSFIPAQVLRQHGVDPSTINLVEIYRALLQRTLEAQQGFENYSQANHNVDAMTTDRVTNPMVGRQSHDSYPHQPPQVLLPGQRVAPENGQAANNDARLFEAPTQRPSTEELQRAHQLVLNVEKEFQDRAPMITFRLIELPERDRLEYHELFEQLHRFALDIHSKLPIFACYMQEDLLRKLYTMLFSTFQQKSFLSAGTSQYFMSLEQVRGVCKSMQGALERYNTLISGDPSRHPSQSQTPISQHRNIPGTIGNQWVPPTAPTPPQGWVADPTFPTSGVNTVMAGPGPPLVVPRPLLRPFSAALFPQAFRWWCSHYGIEEDEALLTYEGRSVDLYALHSVVMHAGGAQKITQNGQWNIVGGQLGFAQIPGNSTEPPKSGPQMAQRIAQVYEKYLYQFDMAYMRSILHKAAKVAQQNTGNMGQQRFSQHPGAEGSQQTDQEELRAFTLFAE